MDRLLRIIRAICIFSAVSGLAACSSAKIKLSPDFAEGYARAIAVVPVEHPDGISRERIAQIRRALESELQNSGFVVLEESLVDRLCVDAACTNRDELISRYGVSGFVFPKIKSTPRYNFLAGYYNGIEGEIRFLSSGGEELFNITHTESERGGLVFDSGQVIQGLKAQARSGGDDAFARLAEKFAENVIKQVPKNRSKKETESAIQVQLTSVEVKQVNHSATQLCAIGAPGLRGYVVSGSERTNLREVEPGKYCGIYLSESLFHSGREVSANGITQVELRSPFGISVQKPLPLERARLGTQSESQTTEPVAGGRAV